MAAAAETGLQLTSEVCRGRGNTATPGTAPDPSAPAPGVTNVHPRNLTASIPRGSAQTSESAAAGGAPPGSRGASSGPRDLRRLSRRTVCREWPHGEAPLHGGTAGGAGRDQGQPAPGLSGHLGLWLFSPLRSSLHEQAKATPQEPAEPGPPPSGAGRGGLGGGGGHHDLQKPVEKQQVVAGLAPCC